MAIEDDVVVVGGGIAGMATALSAAREGAQVRLLSHKESTLRHASGLIDVLGYADGLVADPFEAISGLPEEHPYRTVGQEGIRDGLDLLDSVTDYAGSHTDRNALVPTFGGRIKPTARYPKTSASGLASDDRDTLLVGFETVVDFDAPLAAERLSADVPFDARGVTVAFPGDFRTDARITRLAHALDENERIERTRNGISTSLPARTALAERVKPHLGDAERVGFPAMLGEERPGEVIASLEAELGADVFEVPMGPPSLPGMRLETAFHDALKDEGVRTTSGNPVVDFEGGDELEAVVVERNGAEIPFYGDQFVLATGGLVGKGIDSTRERVSEPIFDCHVPAPEDRYDWSDPEAFGEHSFARFGVETDDELRVLDADGEPEFDNLRAAGGVLGGYDFAAEKSGSGVSLSTGVVAGRIASEQVNVNP
ncbi:glycerol-3-phosphate dehydrogenase subunit GlpB [Haladaptatus sp. T7]|uniref:glycerol-3-phosphate dehydrogenase subunit GlpB n=1 Tax=Haladaptatus sp. T7 TaxID=2029368 RepID=UPI0021A256E4|nr:glycerol-3-phosphate dehydrogenase subunit GlpB [Haladaptatus sp. T7]GKZ13307.1 glycerol-3-phosphate dehydrogenase subunit B [Haladaptatus sp. T7]